VQEGRAVRHVLLGTLLLWPALASAADLSKVDRTIKKEPAYKGKPKYCLLAFGPEAKTRVWVVLDGTDVYVDRNGNGDLTEPGERFPNDGKDFKEFEVADLDGKGRYKVKSLGVHRSENEGRVFLMANVEVVGKYRQYCDLTPSESLREAPVAHFGGPLRLGLREMNWSPVQKLARGEKPEDLYAWVGTFDRANGCWVVLSNTVIDQPNYHRRDFPTDIHPVAEVEFPPARPGMKPVRVRYELKERC
jgi:hypothetical protein